MSLRLATFNLENLGIRPEEDSPDVRVHLERHLEALRETLIRMEADAVAFQELLEPALLEPLLQDLDYPYRVVGERGESPLCVGVFSRYPLQNPRMVVREFQCHLKDPDSGFEVQVQGPFSRGTLAVEWEAPDLPMTLLVVHWKSKLPSRYGPAPPEGSPPWASLGDLGLGRLFAEVKRLSQAVGLRQWVDRFFQEHPDRHLVVLGDFNDELDSEVVGILQGDARTSRNPDLRRGELIPCERSVPESLRFTQIYRGRREMIDHVFLSRSLLPYFEGMWILNETLEEGDWEPDPFRPESDHAPIVVTFRTPSTSRIRQRG